ncbi:hypothetical protein [Pseudomonas aeruginosa]|uniref:hypothetical protein n=1 Tax=Pseudomonas aeruginosa TaxID=287 RepID=UPI0019826BF8|nr:hypothetical protein [Pseudomonas aeruginosa]
MSNELTDVRCPCGAEFQADSYDAGFIAGSGMCQNCDAALPPKDICTCPSGDGSLSHPCPAHPAVEQAGANVGHGHVFPRADGVKMRCGGPGLCSECAADAYRARAALAQPSPVSEPLIYACKSLAQITSSDGSGHADLALAVLRMAGVGDDERERLVNEWKAARAWKPAPAQADEKPGDSILCYGCFAKGVGPDHFDEAGKCLAAQAEQAEAERPEGPTEDELEAAGLGYPLHKEEAVKLWYSGFRSEVITVLEAWEAIGHDIGMNPDKGELLDSLRYMLEKCEAHDAALAEVAGLRSLLNSLLCYVERDIDRMRSDRDKSDNKEIYDRSISLAMERLKAAQNAVFTTEPGCDTAVELAAQTTQAQHCVPEGVTIERDVAGTIHIKVGDFDFIQLQYQRPYTDNASTWKLAERIASLLAAAPGKEVGHE